jgi:hypothetical protein
MMDLDLRICSNGGYCTYLCPHSIPHYKFDTDVSEDSCALPCPIAGYHKDAVCKKLKLRNRYQILKESNK